MLLIDDILTTGATARAAAQALLRRRSSVGLGSTLARAPRSGTSREEFQRKQGTTINSMSRGGNPLAVSPPATLLTT